MVRRSRMSASGSRAIRVWSTPGELAARRCRFGLNIDGLESRFPDSRDQTFFGFTNLSFSNHALDSSYLRAKVVTDLFHDAGLPAPRTAFVRVYLDRGAGAIYLGLYTMIEVPDEPMLDRLFGADSGNLYKPHSTVGDGRLFDKDDFPKKTNEFDEDWTDIQGAIAALNASKQDRVLWRSRLEARFDVDGFLRWLALNTIVGNNDAYGGLSAHNYYLYGSPRHRDRLFWIPWDHDLSLSSGIGRLRWCWRGRCADRRHSPQQYQRYLAADSFSDGRPGVPGDVSGSRGRLAGDIFRAVARERHPTRRTSSNRAVCHRRGGRRPCSDLRRDARAIRRGCLRSDRPHRICDE